MYFCASELGRWRNFRISVGRPVEFEAIGVVAQPINGGPEHALLLTPDGVSSDPIVMSTPEPGSWAVMALAMAAFAAHRARGVGNARR